MNEYLGKKLQFYEEELAKVAAEQHRWSLMLYQCEGAVKAIKEMLNENKAKCQTEEAETPH